MQAQNKTCLKVTRRDLFAILISGLNLVNSFFSYPVLIETTSINTAFSRHISLQERKK